MRLRRAREFELVFRDGRRSQDAAFTVLALDNGTDLPRLGLAVSMRHARGAVRRNRLKRLVRESFRRHQRQLRGVDVVVIARAGVERGDARALNRSLERHWKELTQPCGRS